MTDYISTPISVLNDDLNGVQTALEAKADKSEITAFITEDALSDYATETYVQEYVAEHGGGSGDISACLSTDEFASESYLPADIFGELNVDKVSLVDLGNKLNKVIQLLKRDASGPGGADPTKTYVKYNDGTLSAYDLVGTIASFTRIGSAVTVKLGNTVTGIDQYCFSTRTNLQSVIMPNSLTSIGSHAFDGCSNLTSITIPNSVTDIGFQAFKNTGLISIVVPGSVTNFGQGVFYGCSGLTEVNILSGVTNIGANTFRDCTSLTSVNLPSTVTTIGGLTFYNCPTTVTFEGKTKAEVQAMDNYSWNISTGQGRIVCTDGTL